MLEVTFDIPTIKKLEHRDYYVIKGYTLVIRISCKRIHKFIHLLTYALVY